MSLFLFGGVSESSDPSTVSFVRAAQKRGLGGRVAKRLAGAARDVLPGDPEHILDSRPEFEEVAMRAVIGDAGNLELSFTLVDTLANAVEVLGLARASDVPDPFRRVWVSNAANEQVRGVVLRCAAGEISVFCPPSLRSLGEIGDLLRLSYRGFKSSVDYQLRLNDAVRLPGAYVMHLTRLDGRGSIGRSNIRYDVSVDAQVSLLNPSGVTASDEFTTAEVLDICRGGLSLEVLDGIAGIAEGDHLRIDLSACPVLPESFTITGEIRFIGTRPDGSQKLGIQFGEISRTASVRLELFLEVLKDAEPTE